MAFTANHYKEVARIIRERAEHNPQDPDYASGWHSAVTAVRIGLAEMFARQNPAFDVARFERDCTPTHERT